MNEKIKLTIQEFLFGGTDDCPEGFSVFQEREVMEDFELFHVTCQILCRDYAWDGEIAVENKQGKGYQTFELPSEDVVFSWWQMLRMEIGNE